MTFEEFFDIKIFDFRKKRKTRQNLRLDTVYSNDGGNMEVEFISEKDCVRVVLSGEIDEYCVKMVRSRIDDIIENTRDLRSMIFDMRGVTFIDSTGLGFVLGRYKKLKARHAELLLAAVPKQVDKVFCASGVYRFVPIVE